MQQKMKLLLLFGVSKPDGSTLLIVNLFDETKFDYSINNLIDPKLCTVEYAQTKQVVETVWALGKNAWLWAKDLKDCYYKVSIKKEDMHELVFIFFNDYQWDHHRFQTHLLNSCISQFEPCNRVD